MNSKYYGTTTKFLYGKLKNIVFGRNLKLVCVQYPRCKVKPLMDMLEPNDGIVFVYNEKRFNEGVAREGYDAYFIDHCYPLSPDFGHCTYKGNRLLAENIADAILSSLGK